MASLGLHQDEKKFFFLIFLLMVPAFYEEMEDAVNGKFRPSGIEKKKSQSFSRIWRALLIASLGLQEGRNYICVLTQRNMQ